MKSVKKTCWKKFGKDGSLLGTTSGGDTIGLQTARRGGCDLVVNGVGVRYFKSNAEALAFCEGRLDMLSVKVGGVGQESTEKKTIAKIKTVKKPAAEKKR